jgi:hypothetical protein
VSAGVATVRWSVLAVLVGLLVAGNAQAQTTCTTDKDCPNTACGGQVCLHSSGSFTCVDANTQGPSGAGDGWCADSSGNAVDSNCKCAPQGATCLGLFCTFTVPGAGGATGTGGSTGTAGATGTGSGGSTGSAGTSGGSGGGSGCSVGGGPSFGSAAVVALFAVALMRRRAGRRT